MAFILLVFALTVLFLDEHTSPNSMGGGFMLATVRRQRMAAKVRARARLRHLYYVVALVGLVIAFFGSK
jgi:hypothetical protein